MTEVQHSSTTTEHRADYWDEYYAARATTRPPLALPVRHLRRRGAGPAPPRHRARVRQRARLDLLLLYGHDVTGVDGSTRPSRRARRSQGPSVSSDVPAVDDRPPRTRSTDSAARRAPHLVYARFFVHAITDGEEEVFLDLASELTGPGDLLAVNTAPCATRSGPRRRRRTTAGSSCPSTFEACALQRGFEVAYAVEGFGFAKWRHDDAYVARALIRRT